MIPVCLKVMAYSNRLLWVRNCSSLPAGIDLVLNSTGEMTLVLRPMFYSMNVMSWINVMYFIEFWWIMFLRYSVDRRDCHQAKRRSKYLEIWSSRNKLAGQLLYSDKSIRFKLSGLLSQLHSAKRNQLHRRSTIAIHCLYCLCETCLVLVMWHKLWTVWEQYFLHVSLNTPQLIAKRCITWLIPAVSWPWEENKWRSASGLSSGRIGGNALWGELQSAAYLQQVRQSGASHITQATCLSCWNTIKCPGNRLPWYAMAAFVNPSVLLCPSHVAAKVPKARKITLQWNALLTCPKARSTSPSALLLCSFPASPLPTTASRRTKFQ